MKAELELLIAKYQKQWDRNGMGSGISYSSLLSDLEKLKELKPASSVSSRLESSLGECSEGNKYEIVPYEGVFWINHQVVGSGEPLSQWVESVLNGA